MGYNFYTLGDVVDLPVVELASTEEPIQGRPQNFQKERLNNYSSVQQTRVLQREHIFIQVKSSSKSVLSPLCPFTSSTAGTKGKTNLISIECHRTSAKGKYMDEYSVELMDVGEVLMIHLHKDSGKLDWFVNKIQVKSSTENATFEFVCFRWVLSDETVIQREGN